MTIDIKDMLKDKINNRKIFKNLDVLLPSYVPTIPVHREEEIKKITNVITPIALNEKPHNLFIYGKTGTGKTCIARYVTEEVRSFLENPADNVHGVKAVVVYLNSRIYDTEYQILTNIVKDKGLNHEDFINTPLGNNFKIEGSSHTTLYEKLKEVVYNNGLNLVIILDEIDMIRKGFDNLIYKLTRVNDEIGNLNGKNNSKKITSRGYVTLIGISNNAKVKEKLDQRSKSTLWEEDIIFEPYTAPQLADILEQRIKEGFQEGVVGGEIITRAAAYAAQDGDARHALRLLEKAGRLADEKGAISVEPGDVSAAKGIVERDILVEMSTSLPEQQRIVMYAISQMAIKGGEYRRLGECSKGTLTSGEAYEGYERLCHRMNIKPKTMRQFGNYLNELDTYSLINIKIAGKGYRGNTRLIKLAFSPSDVEDILKNSLGLSD